MKTVWKPLPCPIYDVERLQCWLEDMAAAGLQLQRFRLGTNFAVFSGAEPAAVRYRLSATRRLPGLLDTAPDLPNEEEWQLSDAAGWHYVAGLAEFYIYRCEDPNAPELHTDPQVQALSYKYARSNARWRVFSALWFAVIHPALLFHGRLFLMLVELDWLMIPYLIFLLLHLAGTAADLVKLERLTRRLKRGEPMLTGKDWRPARLRHWLGQLVLWSSLLFLILSVFFVGAVDGAAHSVPLAEYTAPLPFATLGDLAEGELTYSKENAYAHNQIEVRQTLLAPSLIEFEQHAAVRRDGQLLLDGSLYVDYYETRFPLLARQLAAELPGRAPGRYADTPDASYWQGDILVAVYGAETVLPYLVLRQGSRVMGVSYLSGSGRGLQFADILPVLINTFAQAVS